MHSGVTFSTGGSAMEKKILFVITKSNWGGAQRYIYDLATHLPKDRFRPIVALGGEGLLAKKLQEAGIETIPIPGFERDIRLGKEIRAFFHLLSLYKSVRPDVIHLNSSKAGGIGASAGWIFKRIGRTHPRIVFTVHGWGFDEPRPRIQRFLIMSASALTAWFADTIICISKKDLKSAERFIPKKKRIYIPNGIAASELLSRKEARRIISNIINTPIQENDLVIGTIAEFTKNKGYLYLLDALTLLTKKGIMYKAVWIGDGEERNAFMLEVASRGLEKQILFTGFLENAKTYLNAFDVFVLPSLKEGLPYTILEAMISGVPVISTRVGGIPDIVESGENGILVEPKDSRELAFGLERLARTQHFRNSFAERAKNTIQTSYTLEGMMTKTLKAYESTQ
jgi:glycosyltransferase involved in cell wall biosynthesis